MCGKNGLRTFISRDEAEKTIFSANTYFLCVTLLLFLIIITLILSLIPVYLPSKSVTFNSIATESNEAVMYVSTGITITAKRKRRGSSGSLSSYLGAELYPPDIGQAETPTSDAAKTSSAVEGATVTSASLGGLNTNQGRLLSRQVQSVLIVLIIKFRIKFKRRCGYSCQLRNGPDIQQLLQTKITPSTLVLTNVALYSPDGTYLDTLDRIPVVGVLYVSPILPASAPSVPIAAPQTASLVTITTKTTTPISNLTTNTTSINSTGFSNSSTTAITTYTNSTTATFSTISSSSTTATFSTISSSSTTATFSTISSSSTSTTSSTTSSSSTSTTSSTISSSSSSIANTT